MMEYSKLVAVAGLPGLYELISSKTDGAVVRSLDDKSTRFVSSRIHNFSHLESIEVFTTGDNVNLAKVFFAMEKNSSLPDVKDEIAVKTYFQKTYPELDFEKVYSSDLRKMIKWFDVLKKNNIEIKLPEEPVQEPVEEEEEKEVFVEKKSIDSSEKKKATKKEAVTEEKTPASKKSAAEKPSKPAVPKAGKKKNK